MWLYFVPAAVAFVIGLACVFEDIKTKGAKQ